VGPEVPCLLVAEDLIASCLMREEKIAVKQRQSAGGGTSVFRAANLFSGLAVLAMPTTFNQKSCV